MPRSECVEQDQRIAGQRLWSPALKDAVFESRVGVDKNPWLRDYRVGEFAVTPAGWLISAAIDAVQRALGSAKCCLDDVSFESPVVFGQRQDRILQVILTLGELGEMFKIVGRDPQWEAEGPQPTEGPQPIAVDRWTVHAVGSIGRSVVSAQPPTLACDARQRWQESWTRFAPDQVYEMLGRRAVSIGDSYRAITAGWRTDHETLCQLDLAQPAASAFHPALLESCVHALTALAVDDDERVLAPMGIDRAQFFDAPQTAQLWCWLRHRDTPGDHVVADAEIYAEDGRAVSSFEGLYFERVASTRLLDAWRAITDSTDARSASLPRSEFLEQLESAPASRRRKMVFRLVNELTCELLGRDTTDELDPQQGFFDAGMTSLAVVNLSSRLEQALGCSLPTALAITYATPEQLADHLCQDVLKIETCEPSSSESARPSELDELSEAELASRLSEQLKNLARGTG